MFQGKFILFSSRSMVRGQLFRLVYSRSYCFSHLDEHGFFIGELPVSRLLITCSFSREPTSNHSLLMPSRE